MANIMLNEVCNLSCSYCFADKYVNKGNETDISYKNFKQAVEWINHSSDIAGESQRIGIIGGEPLLHHRFKDLIDYAITQRKERQEILIFTNGILAGEYSEYFALNDITLLINLNSPKDIGESKYKKILESIKALRTKGVVFSIGINLYDKDMDFSFLTKIVREYSLREIRVGLICPNTLEKKEKGAKAYFEEIKPALLRLAEELGPLCCSIHLDCQRIPKCFIKNDIYKVKELEEKYGVQVDILGEANCHPVIDILPNLNVVRCFGMSGEGKSYPIESFNTEMEAISFFDTQVDGLAKFIPVDEECIRSGCKEIYLGKCQGGCIAFKDSLYEKMKDVVKGAFTTKIEIDAE